MTSIASMGAGAPTYSDRVTGLACGMGAGALWGLVFLAPKLVGDFGALHLTIGRYFCYGLIAAALVAFRWRSLWARVSRHQWWSLVWLSLAGNTVYYLLLAGAVQSGGIAMTSLVIGFLPIAVTIIGSRDRGAVPLLKLVPSLMLCAAGVVCIGWQAVNQPASGSIAAQLLGLGCAVGALISWTTYAVGNARALHRLNSVTQHEWNLLTGVVTGAQSVALIPLALVVGAGDHSAASWAWLGAVSMGVALLASICGNALWNRMSRLLPLTLVGQMILSETVFALLYGLVWEQRLPSPLEAAALLFVVLSVLSCLKAHPRH